MIYIDLKTFRCYVAQNDEETRIPFADTYFDGKCETFIEGYCCVPSGYHWTGSDGSVYPGGMVFPWKNYSELAAAQAQYEADMARLAAAYREGVNSV